MTKETKKTYLLTIIVCLIPIIAGILLYPRLPDQIVTHWDAAGNPNGWSSRFVGVFVYPGFLLIINLIFPFLLKTDPKYRNVSEKVKALILWIIPAVDLFSSSLTLAAALGTDVKVELLGPLFLGLLLTVIGNYLPKMSPSYTIGLRFPWTLHNEENWKKTHRFAGILWVVCGLFMISASFLPYRGTAAVLLMLIAIIAPAVYSFGQYKKQA